MSLFSRYIGLDYSGAETPDSRISGLRVYVAAKDREPEEQNTSAGLGTTARHMRWNWSRKELADWLIQQLQMSEPAIVGIDHAFSFPLAYFDKYQLSKNWDTFLDDFCAHWPTDQDHVYLDFIRSGEMGNVAARTGDPSWLRLTEKRAPPAKSVFRFGVPGQVAPSTHAGLPWLRRIRKVLGNKVHFWPFDGWTPPAGVHAVAEVYPRLWRSSRYPMTGRNQDQRDAYAVCRRLQEKDLSGDIDSFFNPALNPHEKTTAEIEGWILGVP